jgi:hypothetical protein
MICPAIDAFLDATDPFPRGPLDFRPVLSQNSTSLILLAGAVLALWLVMRRGAGARQSAWRKSRDEDGAHRLTAKAAMRSTDEAPVDYLRWQVEMHETARELKGELDSKLAALQALVIMARQESERLEAALARLQAAEMSPRHDLLSRIGRLAEEAQMANPDALSAMSEALPKASTGISPTLFDRDRLADDIYRLADRGLPASDIATHLQLPVGHVELVLSLRPA